MTISPDMSQPQSLPLNAIAFSGVHKSITSLDPVSLPRFVVLTGINGSGKTHLLTAIKEGLVSSSLVSDLDSDVKMFDPTSIVPSDTGIFDPAAFQSQRGNWYAHISRQRQTHIRDLQTFATKNGIPGHLCTSAEKIGAIALKDLASEFKDTAKAQLVYESLQSQINRAGTHIANNSINQFGDEAWKKSAQRLVKKSPGDFFIKSQEQFFSDDIFLWGDVDPFRQAFGQLFTTYRGLVQKNTLLKAYPPEGDSGPKPFTDSAFVAEYGEPPWDFVNRILAESNLDFRVDRPPMHDSGAYEPRLKKVSRDVEMRFQDLSSGEKVLMSFALCMYNSQESRQAKAFPKLLLLDEIDAPLHPSMTVSLLRTIQNVLVRDKQIAVILTTHSPSTVALAPEDSLYAMNAEGPRVEKVSKGRALSLLTIGVPTLSVSFTGRRQVFVESRTDAMLFDLMYQQYRRHLNSERSLEFVEVGRNNDSGVEQNSGCDQVVRLVNDLVSKGNESIFGLIDWDGRNQPTPRIHVLCHGLRDGLETALLDPLLVVAALARANMASARSTGLLTDQETYQTLQNWDASRWQAAVDKLQAMVLEGQPGAAEPVKSVQYFSGLVLNIRQNYLWMDDHKLETMITSKFGHLKLHARHRGELGKHILGSVLMDFEQFMPMDVLNTFNGLLTSDLSAVQ